MSKNFLPKHKKSNIFRKQLKIFKIEKSYKKNLSYYKVTYMSINNCMVTDKIYKKVVKMTKF